MPDSPAATPSPPPATSVAPDRGAATGRLVAGRYRLRALIRAGASFEVYLAEDRSRDRHVAVTCLVESVAGDEHLRHRLLGGIPAVADLDHPNLVAVEDWGQDPDPYLVTELLLGGSVADLQQRGHLLTPSQGLLVALYAAHGLVHAHDRGLIHRGLEPASLVFGSDGRVRVADLGVARAVAEAAWVEPAGVSTERTRYAAPEQAVGDLVGDRSDVYALALIVIEAVTGRVPLLRESALATMILRQDRDVVAADELGPLGPVLAPAGRADPEARPSAAELVEALKAAARELPRPDDLPLVVPPAAALVPGLAPASESVASGATPAEPSSTSSSSSSSTSTSGSVPSARHADPSDRLAPALDGDGIEVEPAFEAGSGLEGEPGLGAEEPVVSSVGGNGHRSHPVTHFIDLEAEPPGDGDPSRPVPERDRARGVPDPFAPAGHRVRPRRAAGGTGPDLDRPPAGSRTSDRADADADQADADDHVDDAPSDSWYRTGAAPARVSSEDGATMGRDAAGGSGSPLDPAVDLGPDPYADLGLDPSHEDDSGLEPEPDPEPGPEGDHGFAPMAGRSPRAAAVDDRRSQPVVDLRRQSARNLAAPPGGEVAARPLTRPSPTPVGPGRRIDRSGVGEPIGFLDDPAPRRADVESAGHPSAGPDRHLDFHSDLHSDLPSDLHSDLPSGFDRDTELGVGPGRTVDHDGTFGNSYGYGSEGYPEGSFESSHESRSGQRYDRSVHHAYDDRYDDWDDDAHDAAYDDAYDAAYDDAYDTAHDDRYDDAHGAGGDRRAGGDEWDRAGYPIDHGRRRAPITRFDLPPVDAPADADAHPDVRNESRGRYGNVVAPSPAELAAASGAAEADEFPVGDGFDVLKIGREVAIDPDTLDPVTARELGTLDLRAEAEVDRHARTHPTPPEPPAGPTPRQPASPFGTMSQAGTPATVDLRNGAVNEAPLDEDYAYGSPPAHQPPPPSTSPSTSTSTSTSAPASGPADLARRWAVPAAAALLAVLALGAALAVLGRSGGETEALGAAPEEPTTAVGSYLGLTLPEVEAEADVNDWVLEVVEERQDGTSPGTVTRQFPAAGESLAPGSTLVVEVSLGPELRSVPRVVGLTVDEAEAVLDRAELRLGAVTERSDDEVEPGRVLAARVEGADAADRVETGTGVDLVISSGPSAVPMPSFVGLTLDAALAQADDLGMVVTREEGFSRIYDEGFIIDTTPPTGALVSGGDALVLVVSKGASPIEVPDVIGLSPAEAADALAAAGFSVTDTDGPPNQPVVATDPAVGTSHAPGTEVVITTSAADPEPEPESAPGAAESDEG